MNACTQSYIDTQSETFDSLVLMNFVKPCHAWTSGRLAVTRTVLPVPSFTEAETGFHLQQHASTF